MKIKKFFIYTVIQIFVTYFCLTNIFFMDVQAIEYKTSNVESTLITTLSINSSLTKSKTVSITDVDRVNNNMNNAITDYEEKKALFEQEELERILKEDAEEAEKARRETRLKLMNELIAATQEEESNTLMNNDFYNLALTYVGREGDCFQIAIQFINEYYGEDKTSHDIYEVLEPEPGDLIFYEDGGLGTTHYAVYLGDGLALQGNYNGVAVIGNVYLESATSPIFYRYE